MVWEKGPATQKCECLLNKGIVCMLILSEKTLALTSCDAAACTALWKIPTSNSGVTYG